MPLIAAVKPVAAAMALSSLSVVANSATLKRVKITRPVLDVA